MQVVIDVSLLIKMISLVMSARSLQKKYIICIRGLFKWESYWHKTVNQSEIFLILFFENIRYFMFKLFCFVIIRFFFALIQYKMLFLSLKTIQNVTSRCPFQKIIDKKLSSLKNKLQRQVKLLTYWTATGKLETRIDITIVNT